MWLFPDHNLSILLLSFFCILNLTSLNLYFLLFSLCQGYMKDDHVVLSTMNVRRFTISEPPNRPINWLLKTVQVTIFFFFSVLWIRYFFSFLFMSKWWDDNCLSKWNKLLLATITSWIWNFYQSLNLNFFMLSYSVFNISSTS